jgi:predicted nucleic acid-binding Zn ribbon protein
MKDEKQCQQCGISMSGRLDKRFCSNQCRANAHNANRRQNSGEQLMLSVNAILRRNRTLLKQASPQGKTTTYRQVLQMAGFDFRHFTHLYRTKQGNTYHFCYDYGYFLLPDEKVLIVNWQPYMEQNKV